MNSDALDPKFAALLLKDILVSTPEPLDEWRVVALERKYPKRVCKRIVHDGLERRTDDLLIDKPKVQLSIGGKSKQLRALANPMASCLPSIASGFMRSLRICFTSWPTLKPARFT